MPTIDELRSRREQLEREVAKMAKHLENLREQMPAPAPRQESHAVPDFVTPHEPRTIYKNGVRFTVSSYTLKGRAGKIRVFWSVLRWDTHKRQESPFYTYLDAILWIKENG